MRGTENLCVGHETGQGARQFLKHKDRARATSIGNLVKKRQGEQRDVRGKCKGGEGGDNQSAHEQQARKRRDFAGVGPSLR